MDLRYDSGPFRHWGRGKDFFFLTRPFASYSWEAYSRRDGCEKNLSNRRMALRGTNPISVFHSIATIGLATSEARTKSLATAASIGIPGSKSGIGPTAPIAAHGSRIAIGCVNVPWNQFATRWSIRLMGGSWVRGGFWLCLPIPRRMTLADGRKLFSFAPSPGQPRVRMTLKSWPPCAGITSTMRHATTNTDPPARASVSTLSRCCGATRIPETGECWIWPAGYGRRFRPATWSS